jgi:hypothetical protein
MQFLVCVECGESRIPLPARASPATKFTCRHCAERICKAADIKAAKRWRRWLASSLGKRRFEAELAEV